MDYKKFIEDYWDVGAMALAIYFYNDFPGDSNTASYLLGLASLLNPFRPENINESPIRLARNLSFGLALLYNRLEMMDLSVVFALASGGAEKVRLDSCKNLESKIETREE